MAWETRLVEGVAVVTMNSNAVNAQNDASFTDLHAAFDGLDRDPPDTGVVLTAEGSVFSAGIDLKFNVPLFAGRDQRLVEEWFARYRATNMRLFTYPRPTVAAINGHVFAGGLVTALACDFRIAAEGDARFSLNEVAIGVPMPAVYGEIIRYAIGSRNAAIATLGGEVHDTAGALRLGFIEEAVPPDRLLDEAISRAKRIPADAMAAYAFAKKALQAPTVAAIERLADRQDAAELAATFTDPGNLRAQAAKYEQLTGEHFESPGR